MKKILVVLLALIMAICMVACGAETAPEEAPENEAANIQQESSSNILIAYFSRVGNTEWDDDVDAVTSASLNVVDGDFIGNAQLLAEMVQEKTGGDLFLIQAKETYPSDYNETTEQARDEQSKDARPALASHVENMDQYDTIVLVYPIWWGILPSPVDTFLEEYDFSEKTILPLATHGGSSMGSTESEITSLCPRAKLLEGLAIHGADAQNAEAEVNTWIDNSEVVK